MSGYHRYAIEGAANAHEERLLVSVKSYHVESVGSNVVSGAAEGHEPEESHSVLNELRCTYGESHTSDGNAYHELHHYYPPAFGPEDVNDGTPQGLDDPREVEPAGIECYLVIVETKLFVHDGGDSHHHEVGDAFRKV